MDRDASRTSRHIKLRNGGRESEIEKDRQTEIETETEMIPQISPSMVPLQGRTEMKHKSDRIQELAERSSS